MQIDNGELAVARRVRTMHVRGDDPDVWIRQPAADFLAVIFPHEDLFPFLPASADIVALLGYWPKAYEAYQLPTYLPLATAILRAWERYSLFAAVML